MKNVRPAYLVALMIVALTTATYIDLPQNDFINFDDPGYILNNQQVKAGLTPGTIVWAFTFNDVGYWQPLTWLSLAADSTLFGLRPGAYHLVNLFLHILNALLLYLALNRMTGKVWRSALVALCFAVHPLNVDSVAWASERKNLLSTLFWMLAMVAWVRYAARPRLSRYLAVAAAMALGLMAKPMLVTLPCVLLLLDYWPLGRLAPAAAGQGRWWVPPPALGRRVLEKVPYLLMAVAAVWISVLSTRHIGTHFTNDEVGVGLRVANGLVSYLTYMQKTIWPTDLAIYYPFPERVPLGDVLAAAGLLAAFTALAIVRRHRSPHLIVGWFWFLGTLVPVLGLTQVGLWPAWADRFAYVPAIGLFIAVSWSLGDLCRRLPRMRLLVCLGVAAVLLSWCHLSRHQVRLWKNSITLFAHTAAVTHNNRVAYRHLAEALEKEGWLQAAIAHYRRALTIDPDYTEAHFGLGVALMRAGDADGALFHYREALRVNPGSAQTFNNLGVLLIKLGRLDEAVDALEASLAISPDYAGARFNLARVLENRGETGRAAEMYRLSLEREPDMVPALFRLGWIRAAHPLAAHRDGRAAVVLAGKLRAIKGDQPDTMDLLAAALAESGRFDAAVEAGRRASALAREAGQTGLADRIENRVRGYGNRRPFRQGERGPDEP